MGKEIAKTREVGFNDTYINDAKDLFTPLSEFLKNFNEVMYPKHSLVFDWEFPENVYRALNIDFDVIKKNVASLKGFKNECTLDQTIPRREVVHGLGALTPFELPYSQERTIEITLIIYFLKQ